jgi:hypothetical protein
MKHPITQQELNQSMLAVFKCDSYGLRPIGLGYYEFGLGKHKILGTKKFMEEIDEQLKQLARDYKYDR